MTAEHGRSTIQSAQEAKREFFEDVGGGDLSSTMILTRQQTALAFGISEEHLGKLEKRGCLVVMPVDSGNVVIGIERSITGWRKEVWDIMLGAVKCPDSRRNGWSEYERKKHAYTNAATKLQRDLIGGLEYDLEEAQNMLGLMWAKLPVTLRKYFANRGMEPSQVRSAIGIVRSSE